MEKVEREIDGVKFEAGPNGVYVGTNDRPMTLCIDPIGTVTHQLCWNAETVVNAFDVRKEWLAARAAENEGPKTKLPDPWEWRKEEIGDWHAHNTETGATENVPLSETNALVLEALAAEFRARQSPAAEPSEWRCPHRCGHSLDQHETELCCKECQCQCGIGPAKPEAAQPSRQGLAAPYYEGYSTANTVVIAHLHTQATICAIGCDSDAAAVRYGLAKWEARSSSGEGRG